MNTDFGPLTHLGLLRFSGADHVTFLQGQLSNDMRRLAAGTPLIAAYSTPQGRVLAVLQLLPTSSGTIAILPRELVTPIRERLRKFLLRAKVQIDDISDAFMLSGAGDARALAAAGLPVPTVERPCLEATGIVVARVPGDATRNWVLAPAGTVAATGSAAPGDAQGAPPGQNWRLADIRAGLPQVFAAGSELFVAQMLNLDLIDGISFSKGCYTGQEIIARTQHLGRIKRRMFRLALPNSDGSAGDVHRPAGALQPGDAVRLADGRSGKFVDIVATDSGHEALAVLNLDRTAVDPEAESGATAVTVATQLALPYRLEAARPDVAL